MTSMILRVAELREAAAAVLLRRGHAQDAEPAQAGDDVRRESRRCGRWRRRRCVRRRSGAPRRRRWSTSASCSRLELGIGKEQRRVEVAEEQALGEAERLRAGEQQFLGLLVLLVDLRGGQGHGTGLGGREGERGAPSGRGHFPQFDPRRRRRQADGFRLGHPAEPTRLALLARQWRA